MRLAAGRDILVENFRPGTLERRGLGYETLEAVNEDLIMVRVSVYGQDGHYRNRPGFARIAHAFSGLSYLVGEPGGKPGSPGSTSLADEQFAARNNLLKIDHEPEGEVVVPNVVPRLSATPGRLRWLGPKLGEHNEEIYGGLFGLTEQEQTGLREAGVI